MTGHWLQRMEATSWSRIKVLEDLDFDFLFLLWVGK